MGLTSTPRQSPQGLPLLAQTLLDLKNAEQARSFPEPLGLSIKGASPWAAALQPGQARAAPLTGKAQLGQKQFRGEAALGSQEAADYRSAAGGDRKPGHCWDACPFLLASRGTQLVGGDLNSSGLEAKQNWRKQHFIFGLGWKSSRCRVMSSGHHCSDQPLLQANSNVAQSQNGARPTPAVPPGPAQKRPSQRGVAVLRSDPSGASSGT